MMIKEIQLSLVNELALAYCVIEEFVFCFIRKIKTANSGCCVDERNLISACGRASLGSVSSEA